MGPVCAGWNVINALWAVTFDMDKELGTNYHERLKNFAIFAEEKALSLSGALTDAKGNRALKPSQQDNPDMYLHVKEVRSDGVVIRGFKNQICGTVGSQYVMLMPTTGLGEGEEPFAVAAAVPRDVDGLTIVETRRPSDDRTEEEGWDGIKSGTTQAYLIFDDVFVPNEFVFMNGEVKYAGACIGNFTSTYRATIGACVAGQGDVMIGAALGMARANGLAQKPFQDKLTQMAINNETTYGLGVGAIYCGKNHPSGTYYPDALLSHVNKVHVATLPYGTKVLAQEISGGIAETGCIPSYKDLMSPLYGKQLLESLRSGVSGEDRVKMARLVEWLTIGGGVPGCMHGGGSPDTAKMVVKIATKWDKYVDYARALADVESPLKEEKKK
jgi:4-hydroxybutyryl-CoA dehydratase/vinylacetyl-CoA-Delta-isomerase